MRDADHPGLGDIAPPPPPARLPTAPAITSLSYSGLAEYARCGYRFYLERVLRLPGASPTPEQPGVAGLAATDRGTIIHALLEQLDFRRPTKPTPEAIAAAASAHEIRTAPSEAEAAEIAATIERFTATSLRNRLAAATGLRREERFGFLAKDVLIVGAIDALAWEARDHALVVDYKSDRLEGRAPGDVVVGEYETQRLIYALAALRAGAASVDVAHVFLEQPDDPVVAAFTREDAEQLESRLQDLIDGPTSGRFIPSAEPHRALCGGCPGEGGLCSWPLALTRRDAPDRLF
jgi:hypothetical protein